MHLFKPHFQIFKDPHYNNCHYRCEYNFRKLAFEINGTVKRICCTEFSFQLGQHLITVRCHFLEVKWPRRENSQPAILCPSEYHWHDLYSTDP